MQITTPAFESNEEIPQKYTCEGSNINPPFTFTDIPGGTQSLALIVEDPDAPGELWVHWMIWNMPVTNLEILEDSAPKGIFGKNSNGNNSWDSICPPDSEHRYFFKGFALDTNLNLDPNVATREDFYSVMQGHILGQAEVMGRYTKIENR